MRTLRPPSVVLAWAMAFGGAGLAGCGDGASPVHGPADAGLETRDARDAADGDDVDLPAGDAELDAPVDASETTEPEPDADADAGSDVLAEAIDATDAVGSADALDAADAAREGGLDAPADVAKEAMPDLPAEKPSATASWTIGSNPMCTAAGAGCMDTGAVGGYQVTASGTCPTASSVQLWFPGGASPLAATTYTVKPAAGILDVIAMPAGMVGVSAERGGLKYWGRSGAAAVTVAGAGRHVILSNVILKQEDATVMTSLAADVTCP
jgi:hypothetical protein